MNDINFSQIKKESILNLLGFTIFVIIKHFTDPTISITKSPYSDSVYLKFENYQMFPCKIRISDHKIDKINYDVQLLTENSNSEQFVLDLIDSSIKYDI